MRPSAAITTRDDNRAAKQSDPRCGVPLPRGSCQSGHAVPATHRDDGRPHGDVNIIKRGPPKQHLFGRSAGIG